MTSPGTDDARLQRMEQAALWLQRMHNADQDERLVDAWLDWCQRDPLNQEAFDELAVVWEISGQLAGESSSTTASSCANADISAAAIPAAPRSRRWALAASLGGIGLVAVVGSAWWTSRSASEQMLVTELSSPIGVNVVETLADGSVLELGGGTRVTVSIGPRARRVELHEGELFVTVHHEADRSFSVEAGRLKVVATGTAFNVLRSTGRTTVTVAEGSVDALYEGQSAATPNVRLESSQQLVYSHATHRVVVRQADPRDAIAWRSGTLHFQREPLAEVIATVNRYTEAQVLIDDARIAELPFTGTARIDRIDGWLQGLPHIFSVDVVQLADGSQLIRPRPDGAVD